MHPPEPVQEAPTRPSSAFLEDTDSPRQQPIVDIPSVPTICDAADAPLNILEDQTDCVKPAKRLHNVWGLADLRGYVEGEQNAPNGVQYQPLFSFELNFNFWLWQSQALYVFTDQIFWAQKATPGVTNAAAGQFDFSKREYDLSGGLAWNYSGRWEARLWAFSGNNLNRGFSLTAPNGFNDGVVVENRYYLNETYDALGTPDFDLARATFVSIGAYPSDGVKDLQGNGYTATFFARAYLTYDLWQDRCYLFADTTLITETTVTPKLLLLDAGIAYRPFSNDQSWEFRVGSSDIFDLQANVTQTTVYIAARLIY